MYLRRKIDTYLEEWKVSKEKKPLIVKGARQIGKSESILHFANENYKSVIYINFALETKYQCITDNGYSADEVVKNITLLDPSKRFIPGETVIIFDELQDFPDIATTLKSFCMKQQYDVICSGSLLGVHYKKIHSNSVGYKMDYVMYSMDFEEFLWAKGYDETKVEDMLEHMLEVKPFSSIEMQVYQSLFMDYCILGGMPAVVRSYIEQNCFSGSLEIQRQILLDYEEDIRKYAQGLEQTKLLSVYRHIPAQLAKENKKFQYSLLGKNARAREYQGCIEWLKDAGVINACYAIGFPELPLKGNYDESKFKLYYSDTGLLIATLDEEAQEDLRANKNLGIYKGALYENFVAEALVKQGYGLYYFVKENSTLEEDFFVRTKDELIPIEVKANKNTSKSLATLIKSERYADIRHGFKISAGNIGYADNIYTFPYFCTFLLQRLLKQSQ